MLAIAVIIAAVVTVSASGPDTDSVSYSYGREWGSDVAGAALRRDGLAPPRTEDFAAECAVRSKAVAITGLPVNNPTEKINADDYEAGCMDAVRDRLDEGQ